jgi:hypothetical protein
MALADRLSTPTPARRFTRCVLGRILDNLSTEDRSAVERALSNEDFSTTNIRRELIAEGQMVGLAGVQRHRNGECCCVAR